MQSTSYFYKKGRSSNLLVNMPRRTNAQRTGSLGQSIVTTALEKTGQWIARQQNEDFGVDLEAELSNPDPSGHFLKIQVKSSAGKHLGDAPASLRLSNSFLRYAHQCRVPFILIQVATETGMIWCCWLQECFEVNRLSSTIYNEDSQSTRITSDWFFPFDALGCEKLSRIARGVHPLSIAITLRTLLQSSIEAKDYASSEKIVDLIKTYQQVLPYLPVDILIDATVELGERMWGTREGNALSSVVFELCRVYGNSFNREQIRRLVVRGQTYSRTGINALGILYDEFFEHINALELSKFFANEDFDCRIRYYCLLREKYIGKSGLSLAFGGDSLEIEGFIVSQSCREDLVGKWPNRGDSAILDCVIGEAIEGQESRPPGGSQESD